MHQSPDDFTQANLTFSFDFFGQGQEAQMTPPSAVPSQSDSRTHATVTQIFPSQAKRSRLCKYMKFVLDKNDMM